MNKKSKSVLVFLVLVFVFIASPCRVFAYQWPVSPFVGSHPITGTLGEWRSTHLHAGVDIGRGAGTQVYSSVTDIIPEVGGIGQDFITVGCFDYVHISTAPGLIPGQEAIAGQTLLGTVDSENHLHLEESDGGANPLRVGGLDNYADGARTYVSSVEIYRQGTGTQLAGAVWGDADILSLAWDSQNSISNKVSVYRIAYRVKNTDDEDVVGPIENIQFDDIVNASRGLVYANFEDRQSTRH